VATRLARLVAVLAGLLLLVLGLWALVDPRSFFDQLANFPPYNRHLFHDVGAFQAGIGATLLLSAFARDPLLLGLTGASVGAVLHAVSHVIDRDLGGRSTDPWALSLLALIILVATLLRASEFWRRTGADAD
jgi:hypothetical protein